MRRKILASLLITLLVVIGIGIYFWTNRATAPNSSSKTQSSEASPIAEEKPATEPPKIAEPSSPAVTTAPQGFNKSLYSIDEPSSLWVIVNKKRPLPENYAPSDLTTVAGGQMRAQAATALNELLTDAKTAGYNLQIISSYRSFSTQSITYNGYVARDGQAKADTYSARPGHSEHQTGLAVDLGSGTCNLEICFGDSPAGKWLAANAWNYGFVIRYQKDKTAITGYQYEPWHIRFVGKELASEIKTKDITLEEFFGLPTAPNY